MISIGIDVGARFWKAVAFRDDSGTPHHVWLAESDTLGKARDNVALKHTLRKCSVWQWTPRRVVSSGMALNHGRRVPHIPESLCLARAAHATHPEARIVMDLGAFSIRALQVDSRGSVIRELENERCAAGGGRFLETIAGAVEVSMGSIDAEIEEARAPCGAASGCIIFAESEMVSAMNRGARRADVLAGCLKYLASKASCIIERLEAPKGVPLLLFGGVATIRAFGRIIEAHTGHPVLVPPFDPRLGVAWGAALSALNGHK